MSESAPDLARLEGMLRIRRFEEKAAELYSEGSIRGFLHLCIGQEAVAVGVMRALGSDDAVVSTYREHGHALARGVSMRSVMAEMFGKLEGCSHGRGGSMHLFDATTRFYGGNAIVGGGLSLAVGLALADKLQNRSRVTACLFGDGAVAEGVFHESLNLAMLWRLPVLFLCENNLYAMGTALSRAQAQTDLCVLANSYTIPASHVDGMDVRAVEDATRRAMESVRSTVAPVFLEFATYRFRAHSMFDPELYRDKGEVAQWKERDPIRVFGDRMRSEGALDDARMAALERSVVAEIDDAVSFAKQGHWEPVEELEKDVLAGEVAHGR